jgi:antirestriction protein ArdC
MERILREPQGGEFQDTHKREHVYDKITDRIIKALEVGTVPWQKPWGAARGRPRSMTTGKPYQGNIFRMVALLIL